jgi:hypothetical protein
MGLQRFSEPLKTVLSLDAIDWYQDYLVGNCWAVVMVNLPLNLNPNHFAVPARTEQGHLVRPSVREPLEQTARVFLEIILERIVLGNVKARQKSQPDGRSADVRRRERNPGSRASRVAWQCWQQDKQGRLGEACTRPSIWAASPKDNACPGRPITMKCKKRVLEKFMHSSHLTWTNRPRGKDQSCSKCSAFPKPYIRLEEYGSSSSAGEFRCISPRTVN